MSRFRYQQSVTLSILAFLGVLALPSPARAQYLGHNFHGDFGVNSGTLPGPGFYFVIPFGQWNMDQVRDADGNQVLPRLFQGLDLRLVPSTAIVVTPKKLLGANYGFTVTVPFSTVRPERATLQEGESGWGLHDLYVVPLQLSWHAKQADFVAGYGFFAPTGRYEADPPEGEENIGLGMWSHEIQFGTTVFLDPAKKFSAATTAYVEFHSKKKDQDLMVGNLLTLEGGFAYNVPKIGGAFGVGYFLQNKLGHDTGSDVPLVPLRLLNLYGHNKLFGIGPDVTMAVFSKGRTIGLVNVRYLWESAGKSSFQGSTFVVGFTIARPKAP